MDGATAQIKVTQVTDPYDLVHVNLRADYGIVTADSHLLDKVMAILQWISHDAPEPSLNHEVVWAESAKTLEEYLDIVWDSGHWAVLWRSDK